MRAVQKALVFDSIDVTEVRGQLHLRQSGQLVATAVVEDEDNRNMTWAEVTFSIFIGLTIVVFNVV